MTSHRSHPGRTKRLTLYTVLPAVAAAAGVWGLLDVVGGTHSESTAVVAQQAVSVSSSASHDRTVQLVGQVVAISPVSITTRAGDGTTTTFAITPSTTQINTDGVTNPVTGEAFSIDETVSVVGVLRHGTPVATALADQHAADGSGPPMDGI